MTHRDDPSVFEEARSVFYANSGHTPAATKFIDSIKHHLHSKYLDSLLNDVSRFFLRNRSPDIKSPGKLVALSIEKLTNWETLSRFEARNPDSFQDWLRTDLRRRCAKAMAKYLEDQRRNKAHTIRQCNTNPKPDVDKYVWLYLAVNRLKEPDRTIQLARLGWHPDFIEIAMDAGNLQEEKEAVVIQEAIAAWIGKSTSTVSTSLKRSKEILQKWARDTAGGIPDAWLQIALNLPIGPADDIRPLHAPASIAEYEMKVRTLLVDKAPDVVAFLQLAAEADLRDNLDEAVRYLASASSTFAGYRQASSNGAIDVAWWTYHTESWIVYDHLALEMERHGHFDAARSLLQSGAAHLEKMVPDPLTAFSADRRFAGVEIREGIQEAIKIRRFAEAVKQNENVDSSQIRKSLQLLRILESRAEQTDHKRSIRHQSAVNYLLLGELDLALRLLHENVAEFDAEWAASTDEIWDKIVRNHRVSHEWRRIGSVNIARAKASVDKSTKRQFYFEALDAFYTAISISMKAGFLRYVNECNAEIARSSIPEETRNAWKEQRQ